MPRYSDLFAKQPAPARGGRLSALSREELQAYVDDVAPTFAQRFGNEVRANAPPNYETGTLIERGQRDLARMGQPMTLDQAAVATAGVPGLGDVVGLAADARAVYDDPSWANIGGAALGALPFVPAMGAIRAFHGSPHDFDKFDISKIGTGEGAQAYGHGLYFAEAEDTARSYRDMLSSDKTFRVGDNEVPSWVARRVTGYDPVHAPDARTVADYGKLDATIADFEARLEQSLAEKAAGDWNAGMRAEAQQKVLDGLYAMAGGEGIQVPGRMYEVNINADPDDFLDWDRPLSEQPEKVRDAFNRVARDPAHALNDVNESMRPSYLLPALRDEMGGIDWPIGATADVRAQFRKTADAKASEALREAGIPGIKYLDQGSRAAGEGSRNYVVFDDKLIDIIRKYGIGALLGGSGAFGLMSLQGEDGTQPPL